MGIVDVPAVTGPAGSVFGENSFYRETWGTRRGTRQVAKCSSESRIAYPEFNVQVRVLVVLPPLPHGGWIPGASVFEENSFHRATEGKWA